MSGFDDHFASILPEFPIKMGPRVCVCVWEGGGEGSTEPHEHHLNPQLSHENIFHKINKSIQCARHFQKATKRRDH